MPRDPASAGTAIQPGGAPRLRSPQSEVPASSPTPRVRYECRQPNGCEGLSAGLLHFGFRPEHALESMVRVPHVLEQRIDRYARDVHDAHRTPVTVERHEARDAK